MSTLARGSRTRRVIAIVALTLLMAGAAIALWPRPAAEASAEATDPHGDHVSALVSGSDAGDAAAGGGSAVVPPGSDSVGNSPQTSLAAAAGSDPLTSGGGATGGTATTGPSGQSAAQAEAAAPTRNGAAGLGGPRPDVKPTDVFDPAAALGGCSAAYGDDGQCLPTIPPSQAEHAAAMVDAGLDPASMPHPWTCLEVREYFADGIAVRVPGVDPDGLDDDTDGIACEPD